MSKIVNFSDMLVAKFCHDIAGPITAIVNGVEFLEETSELMLYEKSKQLVHSNSKELLASFRFFRMLYGMNNASGEIDYSELKQLVDSFFEFTKIKLVWQKYGNAEEVMNITSGAARLLTNMAYLGAQTIIGDGVLSIDIKKIDHHKVLHIKVEGHKLKVPVFIKGIITDHEQCDTTIENIQIHLTAKLAAEMGVLLESKETDTSFELEARF